MTATLREWPTYHYKPANLSVIEEVEDYQPGKLVHTRCAFDEALRSLGIGESKTVPAMLLLESILQSASILALGGLGVPASNAWVQLMTIENVRFKAPVASGNPTDAFVRILNQQGETCRFEGRIDCCDQNAVFAQLIASYQSKEETPE